MECIHDIDHHLRHVRSLSDFIIYPKQVFQGPLLFILFTQSHSVVRIRRLWYLQNLRL
jgi:hypothetical protein